MHVDVREVRDNCGFAYAGQGQIMNLSQISGHDTLSAIKRPWLDSFCTRDSVVELCSFMKISVHSG